MSTEFWNNRYAEPNYAYGLQPNEFFAAQLKKLPVGKILLPAEGEGRNAVFASKLGWEVHAFDTSEIGKYKALALAKDNNVVIDYKIGSYDVLPLEVNRFDCIAAVFNHIPSDVRKAVHNRYVSALKPGGVLIMEAFDKKQLGRKTGGPNSLDMLYDVQLLKEDFAALDIVNLSQIERVLREGPYHNGKAEVVQFVGIKNAQVKS
jgi:hypothetical protein